MAVDNSCVTLGSNFISTGEMDTCKRWDKNIRQYIDVSWPEAVKLYNKSIGEVDNLDFLVAIYKTCITSRNGP